jgi:tetratricopeptide (TPR) repeat protein
MRGHLNEGRDRAERAVRLSANLSDPGLRGRALEAAGSLAYWQADFAAARERYAQALGLQRQTRDETAIANALYNLSFADFVSRDDPERGRQLAEEALAIYRRVGDRAGIANTLWALGGIENTFPEPRSEVSRRYFHEARQLFEELGNRRMLAWAHFMYAGTVMHHRDTGEARPAAQQALRLFNERGDVSGCALTLRGLSVIEWVDGHREAAARLGGAADRVQRMTGVNLADWTSGRWAEWGAPERFDRSGAEADPALAAAWSDGEQLDVQEAVAEVLRGVQRTSPRVTA